MNSNKIQTEWAQVGFRHQPQRPYRLPELHSGGNWPLSPPRVTLNGPHDNLIRPWSPALKAAKNQFKTSRQQDVIQVISGKVHLALDAVSQNQAVNSWRFHTVLTELHHGGNW